MRASTYAEFDYNLSKENTRKEQLHELLVHAHYSHSKVSFLCTNFVYLATLY